MARRVGLVAIALLFVTGLAAWAYGQFGAHETVLPQLGRYAVAPAEGTVLLVDTTNGKTWMLARESPPRKNPVAVWLPLAQFDDMAKADEWLMHNQQSARGR